MHQTLIQWFDDEGAPVNGGCQSRVCRFAHPDEDRWYSLPKSNKRPFRERYIDHDDDRVRDRGWDDRRPPRRRRRRSSSPASTSRSRSPSHRRRERRSSDYPSESPTTRRMSVDKHQSERGVFPFIVLYSQTETKLDSLFTTSQILNTNTERQNASSHTAKCVECCHP